MAFHTYSVSFKIVVDSEKVQWSPFIVEKVGNSNEQVDTIGYFVHTIIHYFALANPNAVFVEEAYGDYLGLSIAINNQGEEQ